jgi:dihydroxyacetone kinase-like protein
MLATKGRASFLGERSIGHIDPGARSSQILVNCACDIAVALSDSQVEPA